jgi:hypothetical protein
MRRLPVLVAVLAMVCRATAQAQDAPPPIGPFVADVRGAFTKFPISDLLAASRGMSTGELPSAALGLDAGAHLYFLKWKAVTFGLGGEFFVFQGKSSPVAGVEGRSVTERLTVFAPQLSFNFGSGDGWSYITGGIGSAKWSVVPDDQPAGPADRERLFALNYGGGARWFINKHLAVSLDARFHEIHEGTPHGSLPAGPRATMFVVGAGISIK